MTDRIPVGEVVPPGSFAERLAERGALRARSEGDKLNSIDGALSTIRDTAVLLASEQREQQLNERLDRLKERLDSLVLPLWIIVGLLAIVAFR